MWKGNILPFKRAWKDDQVLPKNPSTVDPTSAIDYANIASNYRDMGDKENAIRYYLFALELDPTIDFARENLIKLEEKVAI